MHIYPSRYIGDLPFWPGLFKAYRRWTWDEAAILYKVAGIQAVHRRAG